MTNYKRIVLLLKKKLLETIDENEENELRLWAHSNAQRRKLLEEIGNKELFLQEVDLWAELEYLDGSSWNDELHSKVVQKIKNETNRPSLQSKNNFLWIAAVFSICFSIGLLYFYTKNSIVDHPEIAHQEEILDVPSGKNKASITLADGSVIDLDENKKGIVLGEKFTYLDGSEVIKNQKNHSSQIIIHVPRGGRYQVSLSDGSKVWVNSDSKLIYPQTFSLGRRMVELEGEAYFDIQTKFQNNKRVPFLVKTKTQTIEVLGTEFNVKAYPKEETSTVLVEGRVKIKYGNNQYYLSPGHMSISTDKGLRIVDDIDVSEFIAWKYDKFIFNETPLSAAMAELSRWYNVKVQYKGGITSAFFYGEISRNKSLKSVLNILKEGGVHFELQREKGEIVLYVSP